MTGKGRVREQERRRGSAAVKRSWRNAIRVRSPRAARRRASSAQPRGAAGRAKAGQISHLNDPAPADGIRRERVARDARRAMHRTGMQSHDITPHNATKEPGDPARDFFGFSFDFHKTKVLSAVFPCRSFTTESVPSTLSKQRFSTSVAVHWSRTPGVLLRGACA